MQSEKEKKQSGSGRSNDEGGLSSKISRYGRVSGTVAGLAAKLAGERFLGLKIDRGEHAGQLMQSLGNLKGPLMKVGQILATIPEALPEEYASAFENLQSNAPPMGWTFVRRRMKAELGHDWQAKFREFGRDASAAASLGQVHKAVGLDGRVLACKLQYPDMAAAIEADLSQLKILFSLYERYDKAIKTKNIHQELSERLREELDYEREAKHCKMYAYMLMDEGGVNVPEIIDELSTKRLLTATWVDGKKILSMRDAPQEDRNTVAMNMFRAWYVPFYGYGVIHGDPHLGNYSVRDGNVINLLDFGCVRFFKGDFIQGVIDLYRALQNNDSDLAVHAYETWGFKELSKERIDVLNIWAGFLYGPLLEDKVRPIGEVTNGIYGRETAEKVHKELRETGGVTVPREFVFMDRAALGLGSVFLHLKAEVNWFRVFNKLIQGFDPDVMDNNQDSLMASFKLSPEK